MELENKMLIDAYWRTYDKGFDDDEVDIEPGEYDWLEDMDEEDEAADCSYNRYRVRRQ